VSDLFAPFDLAKASAVQDIDDLPFGVIVVDRAGTILEYNVYESELTGFARERVLGRNFFHDVAPCTAIQLFRRALRRVSDVARDERRTVRVYLSVRPRAAARLDSLRPVKLHVNRATICVARRPNDPPGGHDGADIRTEPKPR